MASFEAPGQHLFCLDLDVRRKTRARSRMGRGQWHWHRSRVFGTDLPAFHPAPWGEVSGNRNRAVQKGVERMGGRVGVDSVLEQGSRFWFE